MKSYKFLNNQKYSIGRFSIVPIRDDDKYMIMEWRNEQMYHLRQKNKLTRKDQDIYFETVIESLFNEFYPTQILFSYLENDICVGYGGLVHINWDNRNAEISFIMETKLESEYFEYHWGNFLKLIEQVSFCELRLHKIYTYAYDLRPKLYSILSLNNYAKEAKLKEHVFYDNKFIDVLIHSKVNETVSI